MRGIVKMKSTTQKLTTGGLLFAVILACAGCSKHSTPTPVTKNTDTTTTSTLTQYGTPYANMPATSDIVIYEVNERTVTPATLNGVTARLDSIKALGVNVIWLMPTYPIGVLKSVGSPYCVMNYEQVNPSLGTLADLRNLVAAAHTLGMAVILDWEANDTSWDNAWITSNPNWYVQNSAGVIQQLSTYTDVAALNFNNENMRLAMIKAMKYWVYTANIDGYRCDDADNAPADFWTQALDTLNNIKTHKLLFLAEGTNGAEISSGFQLGYAFSYYSTIKSVFAGGAATTLTQTNAAEEASLPSPGLKLRYITNHDDANTDGSTISEYGGKAGAEAAFILAAYMGGVPLIYDSQEVGYASAIDFFNVTPVDYTANPDMVALYKQILAFRAAHAAIKTGTLTDYSDSNISAFSKVSGTDNVAVLVNTKNGSETYSIPAALQNTTWKNGFTGATVTLGTQYTFPAYQYLVLSK